MGSEYVEANLRREALKLLNEIQEYVNNEMRDWSVINAAGREAFRDDVCDRLFQLCSVIRMLTDPDNYLPKKL